MKLSVSGQRDAIRAFRTALQQATADYRCIEEEQAQKLLREKEEYAADRQRMGEEFQAEHDQLNAEYLTQLEAARVRYEQSLEQVAQQERDGLAHLEASCQATTQQSESDCETLKAREASAYEEAQRKRKQVYRDCVAHCEQYRQELAALVSQAEDLMRRRGCLNRFTALRANGALTESPERSNSQRSVSSAEALLAECSRVATAAATQIEGIRKWRICRFADEGWPILVLIFTCILTVYPFILTFHWTIGAMATLAFGVVASVVSFFGAQTMARTAIRSQLPALAESLDLAERSLARARVEAQAEARADLTRLHRQHDDTVHRIEADHQRVLTEVQRRRHEEHSRFTSHAETSRQKLQAVWDGDTNPIRQRYLPLLESRQLQYEQSLERRLAHHQQRLDVIQHQYEADWQQLSGRWSRAWQQWLSQVDAMNQYRADHFPHWEAIVGKPHQGPATLLPAIPLGQFRVPLAQIHDTLPNDNRLVPPRTSFELPLFLGIPDEASLLVQACGEGRSVAVALLRDAVLRFIESLPPGKFRLTIVDPTGLGQNFSELMHLADFDERLVRSRIWTEPNHIQQRLVDLTEHMENVIQKYLRNDYASIQEYNDRAGEVAEPIQILAIANFPANFSDEAAQRLVRIVTTGARCGVFTLMSTDSQLTLPRNFDLADLQRHMNTLVWNSERQRLEWCDALLQPFEVEPESPPNEDLINGLVRRIGQAAVDGQRVEVPFRKVMPEVWWQGDCSEQLEIPIGRVGATRFQHLTLGRGTSQHVLLAGKTGSGKSTLLHAMITNAALHFSPAQLQYYLIDFKKGVEFKPYARYRLPHARVIAIESEREFGLSVLERLDAELRARGDHFREQGVQDLAAFRRACPDVATPRILLIIDEFQEFFVKEDKIAQTAALLLDRLVRQGRAFGIHVLLGSQTLSGAYSLARSTIGQMAVRIALQCSETDAHMILSEDNDAARLLSRPGQAIYNDANGLFEGNHPFQVVWLPDEERREILQQLQNFAGKSGTSADQVPLVFEGNVAADPRDNRAWIRTLEGPARQEMPLAPQAWLGAPIAIGPHPAAAFRRQAGQNLVLIGPQADLALATLGHAMLSLMAFSPRGTERDNRFQMLVLSANGEGLGTDLWIQMQAALPEWITLGDPTQLASILREWVDIMDGRIAQAQDRGAARFLIVPRIARFRELQGQDSDFGFSSFSPKADQHGPPSQLFQRLIKEGPAVGMHTLLWCDQLQDLHRWLGRSLLSEFHHRVLLPMNAGDSSQLMDAPEASRLGPLRAIYHRADIGVSEKLRPHGLPSAEWLEYVAQALRCTDSLPSQS